MDSIKFAIIVLVLCIGISGCEQKKKQNHISCYPVKFKIMEKENPSRNLRLTGSAKAWRMESLSFEVSGRVRNVLDENTEVEIFGHKNDKGSMEFTGQVVAELDSTRYDAEVAAAQAMLASAEAEVKAMKIEIEQLAPEDINSAQTKVDSLEIALNQTLPSELQRTQAQLNLAKSEFKRAQELYEKNVGTKQTYDQAQNQLESASALYEQVNAAVSTKKKEFASAKFELSKAKAALVSRQARMEVAKAGVNKANAQLLLALRNQKDCKLFAPFSGIISSRLVAKGAVVGPSRPVAVITMMDPIKIEVAVSAKTARDLQPGDSVKLFPDSLPGQSISGWIEYKSVSADPATRTYNISCVGRNRQITPRGSIQNNSGKPRKFLTREDISLVWNLEPDEKKEGKSLMVWSNSIAEDEKGPFCWILENVKLNSSMLNPAKVKIGRIQLSLLQGFRSFVNKEYSEVSWTSDIEPLMLTVRKDFPGLSEGMELEYIPMDWIIRPGDLVPVEFHSNSYPEGIYVPVNALFLEKESDQKEKKEIEKGHIFIHENGKARKIFVQCEQKIGDTRKIFCETENLEGKQLIVLGAHYVQDGDNVAASKMQESNP